jgi:predicted porin
VYGRLDAGYKDYSTTTKAQATTNTENISYSAFTTSRLGFMGTEDLGGGITARFMLEGALQTSVPTVSSNETSPFQFGRQQWVSLSSAKSGTLMLGKTDSLVKGVMDNFDAGYSNNLTGAYDGMGTSTAGEISGSNVIGNQRDVVARYTSPKFSGFDVTVGLLKQSSDSVTGGAATETGSGTEIGSTYTAGKLALSAGYRSADTMTNAVAGVIGQCMTTATGVLVETPTAAACTSAQTRVTGSNPVAAVNSTTNSTALGASYNFGPVVGFAQYFDQDIKNNVDGTKVAEDAIAVGVRVPMGKTTLFASYTDGEQTNATNVKSDFKGMQIGAKYDLSKRTYGYVAYGEAELQQVGAGKAKAENLAVGITHSF